MKSVEANAQLTILLKKMSRPVALYLSLSIGFCLMVLVYALWLKQSGQDYSASNVVLDNQGRIDFYTILGILVTCLCTLNLYQILINRIQTRDINDTTKQMETLFQNLPGTAYRIIVDLDASKEKRVEFLSEGCLELTGYQASHIIQGKKAFIDLIDEKDREHVIKSVNVAVQSNKMYDFECHMHTKSGQLRWVWHRGRAVERITENETRLEGFVTDITERKAAELTLVEAQAYTQAVLETAVEAVITVNVNGMVKSFNRSAEHMFGYSIAEVKGKSINMLIPLAFSQQQNDFIKTYIDTNKAKSIGLGRELVAVKKDGLSFPIDMSISEVYYQKSRTFVGLIRDISQQRAAEDEARRHREQLAHVARLNVLGEMASGIAHEINQPLAAISLFAQAGKRLLDSDQYTRVPEVFDKLSQHALRAGGIIERIQTMARQHESHKKATDCAALMIEVVQLAEAEAHIYDIEIDTQIAENLPQVMVDKVQIQQVALNLLRNGMQAMKAANYSNGHCIALRASLCENGDIECAVTDSGCGISQDGAKKLFEPFSTTKKNGMGMGLSISRAIIEAHNGDINFYNNINGGATFYFTLPAIKRDD